MGGAGWRAASLGSVFRRALEARGEAGQRHPGPGLLWHTHNTTAAANEFWAAQGQGFSGNWEACGVQEVVVAEDNGNGRGMVQQGVEKG